MTWHSLKNSNLFMTALFTLSVAVVFFIGAITYKHITDLRSISAQLETCVKIHLELDNVLSHVKDAETGQRAYIISEDSRYLKPFIKSDSAIKSSLKVLDSLTGENKNHKHNLLIVADLINKRKVLLQQSITLIEQKGYSYIELNQNLDDGQKAMTLLQAKINKMIVSENEKLKSSNSHYTDLMNNTPLIIYSTLLITLLLISIAFIKMSNNLVDIKNINTEQYLAIEANNLSQVVGSFGNWQLDLQSGKHTYSDNLYRLLGVAPQSFKACQEEFSKFIHPDDQADVIEQTKDLHTIGKLSTFVFRVIRKNNEIRYFRVQSETTDEIAGKITVIGTTTDVTDEILSTKLIEDRNKELELSNNELSAFNHIASHDLQEPLRKIEVFLSRLSEKEFENLSDSGKSYLQRISSSAKRMRVLIQDLLKFSSSSKNEKLFEKINLNAVFENSKLELLTDIEETNSTIICETLPVVNAISFQIEQLFINLIGNSIKYRKANKPAIIKISSQLIIASSDDQLPNTNQQFHKICFEDDGIGFEQEYADKIFVLFSRLHNKDAFEGTGIGLAICKKIIDNHDGYIYAQSSLGIGATFCVFLPA